jgi:hypothetical protein
MLNVHANPEKLVIRRYNKLLKPCPKRNSLQLISGLFSTYLKENTGNGMWCKLMYYILIYIQQDAMLHSSFYLETALHVLGGTTTHHQERKQLYL